MVRVISRLNVGGPAIQVISLARLLEPQYVTTLVRGREDPREGSLDHLAEELGVRPVLIGSLRREIGPADLVALVRLVAILRRAKPRLVHTHAAKGGTVGRLAALVAWPTRRRRPVLVHTFHGHSLRGYFSSRRAGVFLRIEQFLARRTDRLVAVSEQVRDELLELGVAPRERFEVIRLGFDLIPFVVADPTRAQRGASVRAGLGIPAGAGLVTLIARLVPIKRVDRFLRIATVLADRLTTRFLIVGDGELRAQLEGSPEAMALRERLSWAGMRSDMPDVCFASDVVVLTSDNEGTPVSLIEAHAAGVPVVATRVGGVASVVTDGHSGTLVDVDDEAAFAAAIAQLLDEPLLAQRWGQRGRSHVLQTFTRDRLVTDIEALYSRLLGLSEQATD